MKHIYYKDAKGKKVQIEVTDEIATAYRESLREEWRGKAREKYHTLSLDTFAEKGYEIMDEGENAENFMLSREEQGERNFLLKRIKEVLPLLTPLQRKTLKKLYLLHMTQAEIAMDEGVSEPVISKRLARIYNEVLKIRKRLLKHIA